VNVEDQHNEVGTSSGQKLDAPRRMKPEEQIQAENGANRRLGCRSEWRGGGYSLQLTMDGKLLPGLGASRVEMGIV
jgi:hypothetical protein